MPIPNPTKRFLLLFIQYFILKINFFLWVSCPHQENLKKGNDLTTGRLNSHAHRNFPLNSVRADHVLMTLTAETKTITELHLWPNKTNVVNNRFNVLNQTSEICFLHHVSAHTTVYVNRWNQRVTGGHTQVYLPLFSLSLISPHAGPSLPLRAGHW